jgi:hypothetical protein
VSSICSIVFVHPAKRPSPPLPQSLGYVLAKVKFNFDWQGFAALVLVSLSLLGIAYFMFARL